MKDNLTYKDLLNIVNNRRQCSKKDIDMDLTNEEVAKALTFDASGTMKNVFPPKFSEEDCKNFIKI